MLWPSSSIVELDLDTKEEVDPPIPDDRKKTMQSVLRLPRVRVLRLPRTILAGSYHCLISTLDEQLSKVRAICTGLRIVRLYSEEYTLQEMDGEEEELSDPDFIEKLNSKLFQCGIMRFEDEDIVVNFWK